MKWSDLGESVALFFSDIVIRSNNNQINDISVFISWLVNDMDKVIKTMISH